MDSTPSISTPTDSSVTTVSQALEEDRRDRDVTWSEFLAWHRHGMDRRWCGPAVCVTHDGIPTSEAEENEWEQGDDPCTHMIRLYDSPETADAVEANHAPSVWRKPQ